MYDELKDFKNHKKHISEIIPAVSSYVDFKNKVALNVGAGQGMHSGFLQALGFSHIYETDIIDYDNIYDLSFRKLLLEKYIRNGYTLDLKKITFIKTSAIDLLFKDNFFDVVVSINAFEHIPDPRQALREIIRCLKPGGFAFLTFDPLYYCDTGGHMFDFVSEPWSQLLCSEEGYIEMLIQNGAGDADVNDFKYGLNRWNLNKFNKLFKETKKKLKIEIIFNHVWEGVVNESHMKHTNYKKARKLYSKKDLLTRGMSILFKK